VGSRQVKSVIFILITLFFGALIYLLFRPPLSWLQGVGGWNNVIIDISRLPLPVSNFILYHLSDVLWALALAETIYFIKKNLYLAFWLALILTVLFETMQYFKIVKGTGDIWDIIFVAVSLSIYFMIKKRKYRHEEKV
jgi:hypothetical protein